MSAAEISTTDEASAGDVKQLVKRIRARLDRWELDHLRSHAANLAERLEVAEARAESAEARLDDEYRFTEGLQDELRQLAEAQGATLGLTQDSSGGAFAQDFENGGSHWSGMASEFWVCAFRGLDLQTFKPLTTVAAGAE